MKKRTGTTGGFKGKYGVIVVGAGIGGLTSAALLARRGFDVLLLEQSEHAGGCCSSFIADGHTFDSGASVFYGLGKKSSFNFLTNVFSELGISPEFRMLNPAFDIALPDHLIHVNHEKRAFLRQLGTAFPHEAKGFKRLYSDLQELYEMLGNLPRYHAMGRWTIMKICALHPWFAQKLLATAPRSLHDYYRRHIVDAHCTSVLDSIIAIMTVLDSTEIPAMLGALVLLELHEGGSWYPMGGSGAIPAALLESFKSSGGQYASGRKVTEIIVGGGRARGVRLDDGSEIHAERVISDAPKEITFGKLIDNIYISDGLRKQVAYQDNADSFFGVFLGVDAGVVPAGTAVHTIIVPRYSERWQDARPLKVSIPSLVDPSLAPAGRHTVTLISPEKSYGWDRNQNYEQHKVETAREKMAAAERVLPGLSKSVRFMQAASPLTWERLTLRPGGTFGIKMDVRQGMLNRLGNKTEIANLYCTSDATFPGSGVLTVAYSGTKCANLICRETGRKYAEEFEVE
jgi:prolycopene isomerase